MKRIIIFAMVFCMLFSATVYANDNIAIPNQLVAMEENEPDIMPLYTYIDAMSAALNIDSYGHAAWSGSVTAMGSTIRISLYLQRSTNQLTWHDISGAIKTVSDSGATGYEMDLSETGYYYRAKVTGEILDSNKNVLESETIYSYVKYY